MDENFSNHSEQSIYSIQNVKSLVVTTTKQEIFVFVGKINIMKIIMFLTNLLSDVILDSRSCVLSINGCIV